LNSLEVNYVASADAFQVSSVFQIALIEPYAGARPADDFFEPPKKEIMTA
jgi:hypothetical protein